MSRPVLPEARRILVVVRGHVGDLVTAFPALRDVRAAWPRAQVTVLVNEYVRGALDGCPWVDDVVYAFAYEPAPPAERLWRNARLLARLAGRFDVTLGLRFSPRWTSLLGVVTGSRVRAGFHREGPAGLFFTHDVGLEPESLPHRVRNALLLESVGVRASPAYSRLDWLPAPVTHATTDLLREHGLEPGARFALVQLASNWGCNEWRDEKWAALVDHLNAAHGLAVVAIGSDDPAEKAKYETVRRLATTRVVGLLGRTTLQQYFDLVGRAALAVACDSATTQVALAQGTPSVILWGIEPMTPNGPLHGEVGRVMEPVQHWEGPGRAPPPNPRCVLEGYGRPASSCHGPDCRENSSLAQTGVDEVKAKVDGLLERRGASA